MVRANPPPRARVTRVRVRIAYTANLGVTDRVQTRTQRDLFGDTNNQPPGPTRKGLRRRNRAGTMDVMFISVEGGVRALTA